MRAWTLTLFGLLTAISLAQDPIELQRKAIDSLPPMSFDERQQCTKPGEAPTAFSTKFGTPATGKEGKTLMGTHTMSFSWPTAGVYRESHVSIDGLKYLKYIEEMNSKMTYSSDGKKSYMLLVDTGRRQIQVENGIHGVEAPFIVSELNLARLAATEHFKQTGNGSDPKYGRTIHLDGDHSVADIALDRDNMTIHMKLGGRESWVLDAQQFAGHWIPTSIKTVHRDGDPVDVYTTITNIKPLSTPPPAFVPEFKQGTLVVDNNVYYDVDKSGKLVKSKMQPDRKSEYLSWAGMGLCTIFVLSVLVIGSYKLFRKQDQMPV